MTKRDVVEDNVHDEGLTWETRGDEAEGIFFWASIGSVGE